MHFEKFLDTIYADCHTDHQPDHGLAQVREIAEIIPGHVYSEHSLLDSNEGIPRPLLIALAEPYADQRGMSVLFRRIMQQGGNYRTERYLGDYGVVAYGEGVWNRNNWLERVDIASVPVEIKKAAVEVTIAHAIRQSVQGTDVPSIINRALFSLVHGTQSLFDRLVLDRLAERLLTPGK